VQSEGQDRAAAKRNTRQRDAIREVFAAAGRPLSPQEVVEAAKQSLPSLGIATVYRALKEFTSEGWLSAIGIAGGTRYELAEIGHHHHFHCLDCDRTFDIAGCTGNLRKLAPRGFVVAGHELTLSGTCRWCGERA
jgi:Fur family transcriptional regulator, ferric uptake regulator